MGWRDGEDYQSLIQSRHNDRTKHHETDSLFRKRQNDDKEWTRSRLNTFLG